MGAVGVTEAKAWWWMWAGGEALVGIVDPVLTPVFLMVYGHIALQLMTTKVGNFNFLIYLVKLTIIMCDHQIWKFL